MKKRTRSHARSPRRIDRRRTRRVDPAIAAELHAIVDRRRSILADVGD